MSKTNPVPRVSIITPSYNQGEFLERTLLSVILQDYENLEYIIVDGQSTDKTQDILVKYRDYVDLVIIEPDDGQTDALNKGFKRCTGDIIAYLNSDDCYANETVVSKVVQHFQQQAEADVIYGQRYWIDASGILVRAFPYRAFSEQDFYLSDFIPQECAFWRRSTFERVGAYVDSHYEFAMDYELFLRLLKGGAKFLSVRDYFGLFRFYPDQKSTRLWQTKGLPEIACLQETHLGRTLGEKEMISCYLHHFYRAHPDTEPELFKFYEKYWNSVAVHKQQIMSQSPLDQWVYTQDDRVAEILKRKELKNY
jgi:glycosyltransferase involved in cell wall biosynthesis